MICVYCHNDIDPSSQAFIATLSGVVWCRPCLAADFAAFDRDDYNDDPLQERLEAALDMAHQTHPDGLPSPLPDGTRLQGCDAVYFRLPSGQELTVKIAHDANMLVVGHRLSDHPATPVGRNAEGDILIAPGRALGEATITYKPTMPLSGN